MRCNHLISVVTRVKGFGKSNLLRKVTLLLASSFTLFALAVIAPSLPQIEHTFSSTPNVSILTRLLLTIPALAIALASPFVGALIDKYGRKILLQLVVVVYVVSGTAAIWLDSLVLLLVSRFILGIAVGGLLTIVTTLIADYYTGSTRTRMAAAQFSVMVFAVAAGTACSGVLADINWQLPFYMYFAALVLLPLIYISITEPLSVDKNDQDNLVLSADSFPYFKVTLLYIVAIITLLTTFMVPSQLPFLIYESEIGGAREAGFGIALFNLMAALVVLAFRRIWERASHVTVLVCGYTLLATGYYFTATAGGIGQIFIGMAISGSGFAVVIPTFTVWIFDIAPKRYRGRAVGGVTMSVFLGTGLSPIYSQPIADWIGLSGAFFVSGIIQALFIVCFALIGLKKFFYLRRI